MSEEMIMSWIRITKDSERQCRTKVQPIELASIQEITPLPMDMNTFCPSNNNMLLLEKHLYGKLVKLTAEDPSYIKTVMSLIYYSNDYPCITVVQEEQRELLHHQSGMDEANIKIIPHVMDTVSSLE